jgi:hypothetical protein
VDISLIFKGVGVAKSIAELAGILDSMDAKIDRLLRSELNAGLMALDQAGKSTTEQASLLREARGCFNKAVHLESGYRRAVAYLGLATCHHHLEPASSNCTDALNAILELPPVIKSTSAGLVTAPELAKMVIPIYGHYTIFKNAFTFLNRKRRAERIRQFCLDAIRLNSDSRSHHALQEGVSKHLGKPIKWLADIERFKLPVVDKPDS